MKDLRVQIDELYLIKVSRTCLREAKEVFISLRQRQCRETIYSCTGGTSYIPLCLMRS
jgi:hypothetical protein